MSTSVPVFPCCILCLRALGHGHESINRVPTVNHHGGALDKGRLAAAQEENAISHFVGSAHSVILVSVSSMGWGLLPLTGSWVQWRWRV
jgi:hypothetical protein